MKLQTALLAFDPTIGVCVCANFLSRLWELCRGKSGIPAAINCEMCILDGVCTNSRSTHIFDCNANHLMLQTWQPLLFSRAPRSNSFMHLESVRAYRQQRLAAQAGIYIVLLPCSVHGVDYFTRVTCSLTRSKLCECIVN